MKNVITGDIKVKLILFSDCKDVIHYEFILSGQAVTKKKRILFDGKTEFKGGDKAPAHMTFLSNEFLAKHIMIDAPSPLTLSS